jgi:hypothetical protein
MPALAPTAGLSSARVPSTEANHAGLPDASAPPTWPNAAILPSGPGRSPAAPRVGLRRSGAGCARCPHGLKAPALRSLLGERRLRTQPVFRRCRWRVRLDRAPGRPLTHRFAIAPSMPERAAHGSRGLDGTQRAGEIKGTQFTLVDDRGNPAGKLGYENGTAYLELRDKTGLLFRIGSAVQPVRIGGKTGPSTVVTYRDQDGVLRDLTKPGLANRRYWRNERRRNCWSDGSGDPYAWRTWLRTLLPWFFPRNRIGHLPLTS